jgi:hypothetical protein
MSAKNFENIMNYFNAPNVFLKSLNLNSFGSNNQYKLSLKCMNLKNYTALKEFYFDSIDFDLEDLLKLLISSPNITSISFTITSKHIMQHDHLDNIQFENTCKKIESVQIEFRTNPAETFYINLIDSCANLRKLEIRWSRDEHCNIRVYPFSACHFRNSFQHLKELKLGQNIKLSQNNNIDNQSNLNLLKRLDYFSINLDYMLFAAVYNENNEKSETEKRQRYYCSLIDMAKKVNLFSVVGGSDAQSSQYLVLESTNFPRIKRLRELRLAQEDNPYKSYIRNFYDKLQKLEFVYNGTPILVDLFDVINLKSAKNLVELDLSQIHIHLTNSNIGEELAYLKCNIFRSFNVQAFNIFFKSTFKICSE